MRGKRISDGRADASIDQGVGYKASRCEALSGEAPLALPMEGLLKPNNCATRAPSIAGALNRFLEDEHHLVLGFEKTKEGVSHRIFKGGLDGFSLLNPTFSANGALYVRRLFANGAKVALVLRPCEIRAYVELQKLTQIEREDIVAISVDCFGAISSKETNSEMPAELKGLRDYFENGGSSRYACSTCRERRGVVGDGGVRIDKSGALWFASYTETGDELLDFIEGELEDMPQEMLLAPGDRAEKFQTDMEEFSKDFAKCIMCKNCRDMCPVCYCIDCVFNGDEYLPKGDALLNRIFRTGSTTMPQGKELFHLVRMFHVSQTCVGCGACEEACPQGIPLTKYFKGNSERLQDLFGYMAGRSFEETIPYVTFLEEELEDAED
jgi:formate dehydrogenase subunit beta